MRHGTLWALQEAFLNDFLLEKACRGLRLETAGNTMVRETGTRREPKNSSIFVPRFQRGAEVNDQYLII